MTLLDAIEEYLEDEGIGTIGTDIFDGELPLDGTDIISLILSPSPEPNKAIPYYTQYVDIWARFKNYDDGYSKLQDIFDLLHQKENYELTDYHVYLSYSVGMIDDLDRDAERRHLFKLTLGFVYREGSGTS